MSPQLPASVSLLEAGLNLKGVKCRNRGWVCQRVEAKSCLEAWTGSAPAGDSLQALAESFPASLLVPLEAAGRPRWNVLGSRDCEPEADNAGPAACPARCLNLLLLSSFLPWQRQWLTLLLLLTVLLREDLTP